MPCAMNGVRRFLCLRPESFTQTVEKTSRGAHGIHKGRGEFKIKILRAPVPLRETLQMWLTMLCLTDI